ncbi:MAG: hypothetical protein ACLQBB_02610 [Solirubrobacteraceae bacterium]
MSLAPVPSEQPSASCADCGAPLVADQRYCLSCGKPCSPVRLAFLDVLAPAAAPAAPGWAPAGMIETSSAGYIPVQTQQGASGWLRRNSGLLALMTVLLMCLLVGLLVGHWVSQSKAPGTQTVKIEGLAGLAGLAGSTSGTASSGSAGASTSSAAAPAAKSPAKQEAAEVAEAKKVEKTPPPAPKKLAPAKLQKLNQSTGKKHEEEINSLGAQPIETG